MTTTALKAKNVEIPEDEIGQNTKKWIVSAQNQSQTIFKSK